MFIQTKMGKYHILQILFDMRELLIINANLKLESEL